MKPKTIIEAISAKCRKMPTGQCLLAGISGIDASGKGFITAKLAEKLKHKGFNVAVINVDGWLNLPNIRFDENNAAQNFYENAIRFDEMFTELILPLKTDRSVNLTTDFVEETAVRSKKHTYLYQHIDVILLEGVFLFKNRFLKHFDLKIWIECSFETALKRAVLRSQEGLSAVETVRAYETIYFPAQKIHFERDTPHESADFVFVNE
jgi:uridine kinase